MAMYVVINTSILAQRLTFFGTTGTFTYIYFFILDTSCFKTKPKDLDLRFWY